MSEQTGGPEPLALQWVPYSTRVSPDENREARVVVGGVELWACLATKHDKGGFVACVVSGLPLKGRETSERLVAWPQGPWILGATPQDTVLEAQSLAESYLEGLCPGILDYVRRERKDALGGG